MLGSPCAFVADNRRRTLRCLPLPPFNLNMFEFTFFNLLLVVAWATFALWLAGAFLTVRGIVRQRPLAGGAQDRSDSFKRDREDEPLVSMIVPARNEAGRVLAAAIASMLKQDYESLEVIVVDDRSTDETGAVLRRLAAEDSRLRVVEGAELPAGWLGKPHAMQQGYEQARGEWLLATDADVLFDSSAVRVTIRHALAGGYDAVTLIPHVECVTFWERVFMPAFAWFLLLARPIERVNDESRRADAIGIGGFFLIKRKWLERVGAWRAVRAEVAEDLRLAELLKAAGARLRVEYAPTLVRTRMQTNLREIWEGFTKNLYAGTRFKLLPAFGGGIGVALFSVAPIFLAIACLALAWTSGDAAWLRLALPLLLVWGTQTATFAIVNRTCAVPLRYAALAPLGHLLFVLILFNSALKIVSGRGVKWKGRVLYDRAGVRPPRETSHKPARSAATLPQD